MPMDINRLTSDPALVEKIADRRERIRQPEHAISDMVDEAGNQYVDLVMEGGGMLGIALVGYTWALEEMGLRFLGIGGTSAGSINALLLAALDDPAEKKSPRLLQELGNLDFYRFVDGDGTAKGRDRTRRLVELALDGEPIGFWKGIGLIKGYIGVRKHLIERYGLNAGREFTAWLTGLLASADVSTTSDLLSRMARLPALRLREGRQAPPGWKLEPGRLVIVASDITTETRVEFPDMADLYWAHPERQNPAEFVRASMSIPYFFEPLRVTGLPDGEAVRERWEGVGVDWEHANDGDLAPHILFVDGGITSNFPIDTFHVVDRTPLRPTFGVKLEYDDRYKPPKKLPLTGAGSRKPLASLTGAIFNSARHTLDYEFAKKHPDYRHLVQFIPCTYRDKETGSLESYNWLDFNLSEEHREGLFRQGAEKAIEFIDVFSGPVDSNGKPVKEPGSEAYSSKWAFYKVLRERLRPK
jgi:NTE family protein